MQQLHCLDVNPEPDGCDGNDCNVLATWVISLVLIMYKIARISSMKYLAMGCYVFPVACAHWMFSHTSSKF